MTLFELPQQLDASSLEGNPDLPEGWQSVSVGDLLVVNYGKGLKAEDRKGGAVSVYGSNGIVGSHDCALTAGPTLIIGRKGSVGEVHLSPKACWPIDTTFFIDDFAGLDERYIYNAIRSLDLAQHESSTAIPGLSRDDIFGRELLVPPLYEQKRIVTKVEQLLAKVDAAKRRLAKVPALLKRFRQSVLAAACSGRLTCEWRDQSNEVAEPTTRTRSDELPDGWGLALVGDLFDVLSGEAFKKSDYGDSGVRLLQIANVGFGSVLWQQQNYLPNAFANRHERLFLRADDIVLALNRPILGDNLKVAKVTGPDLPCILYQRVGRLRAVDPTSVPYCFLYMLSDGMREQVASQLQGTDQPYLNTSLVPAITIPLPPVAEQHEIVRRVEALFALADAAERRVAAASARAERITAAVLAKAFRGELVPTEAELARREGRDYEPASVLLDRIRATRAAETAASKKPRRAHGRVTSRLADR
jgi:type I restriction enzyme S subunit